MYTNIFDGYEKFLWKKIEQYSDLCISDYSYGGFLENRTGKFGNEPMIHLGIDITVPVGTFVKVPSSCIVIHIMNDNLQSLGWGSRIVFKLEQEFDGSMYMIYGHLGNINVNVGDKLEAGDIIGEIGNELVNGGWFPHLHVQLVNPELIKFYPIEDLDDMDGYCHDLEEDYRIYVSDPSPLIFYNL
jgi:murein DD-endopeptidase MepM/ murein hydrolase activator NlpD